MNELALIRSQLAAERAHVGDVARACVEAARDGWLCADNPQAAVDYLVYVLARFEERDQLLADRYQSRLPASDPLRAQLEAALHGAGSSREALTQLQAALASGGSGSIRPGPAGAWTAFAQLIEGPWRVRRDALEALLESSGKIADWRAISLVDANGIVRERALYARAQNTCSPCMP